MRRNVIRMLILAAIGLSGAGADTLLLTNGQKMEGLIEKETPREIILGMGVGTIRLSRSQVSSIQRSSAEASEKLRQTWQRQYFTHDRFIPPGLEDLAAGLIRLSGERSDAARAMRDLSSLPERRDQARRDLEAAKTELVQAAQGLQQMKLDENPEGYNAMVERHNTLYSRTVILADHLAKADDSVQLSQSAIARYLQSFADFNELYARSRDKFKQAGESPREQIFFEEADRRLADWGKEVRNIDVPCEHEGGHVIVTARINDRANVRLMFDTGASFVSFSETMAKLLGLALPPGDRVFLELADGRKTSGTPVTLDSVRIGDAVAYQVQAVVTATRLGGGLDGLLGMSFLREFSIRYDPRSGRLHFRKFEPSASSP